MFGLKREIRTSKLLRFLILLPFLALLITNSIVVKSFLLGTIASLGFLALVSLAIGELIFSNEKLFFRSLFGFASLLLFLAVSGFGLMLVGKFTENWSLVALVLIGVLFSVFSLRRKNHQFMDQVRAIQVKRRKNLDSYLTILVFLFYAALAFRFLLLARTVEGGSSVWLEISPLFIPIFAVTTLFLCFTLLLSPVGDGLKLVLLSIYTFLAHSLFLIVWYPSRYGDPLSLLGHARYTSRTGTIYALGWLTSHYLIEGIVSYRAQFSLTIFFERMFSVDIYWVHAVLVPLIWSIFVPTLAYEIAKLIAVKKSRAFPILTALSTSLSPLLILWGAISVPNSLGFVFFFLSAMLLLRWMKSGTKSNWLMAFLAVAVTLFTHLQPGLFALMLFAWGNIIRGSLRKPLKIVGLLMVSALYPAVLHFYGVSFSTAGLFVLDNFLSFQSEITTILLFFGLLGLILGVRGKYVNTQSTLMLFGLYITVLIEYYLTKFGMTNMPYGPARILVIGDLLIMPFVALGLLTTVRILTKRAKKNLRNVSFSVFSRKVKSFSNLRLFALTLLCLFVSAQATLTLYQSYPRMEAVQYQPSAYMIEAVEYIDADAPGRYVVLCDPIISSVAIGFLGIDYGWAGGVRGVFGMPDWTYPTVALYWEMTKQPSISFIQEAMSTFNATVGYFVVWIEHPRFDEIVQQTSTILPVNKVFGEDQLYIFKYPLPIVQEPGPPVKVVFDDGISTRYVETEFTYMFETEINSTLTLFGHNSYNITEYPIHWTFLDLTVNDTSWKVDESSNVNTFIYVKDFKPDDLLTVKWRWNSNHSSAVWKEDSFKDGWRTHDVYPGTITPTIVTDGNVMNMSYSFTPGPYLYYYYIKFVNVSVATDSNIVVRWKSDAPIAVVVYYFEMGLSTGANVVPIGSVSEDWTLTVVKLPQNLKVTYVMVGISNLNARSIDGMYTLSVDYILI